MLYKTCFKLYYKLIKVEISNTHAQIPKPHSIRCFTSVNQMRTILPKGTPCRGKLVGLNRENTEEGAKDLSARSRGPPRALSPESCPLFEGRQGSGAF